MLNARAICGLYPSQLREFYPKNFSQKCRFTVDAYDPEGKEKRQKASQWRHELAPWKLALEENLIQFNSNAAAESSTRSRDRGLEAIPLGIYDRFEWWEYSRYVKIDDELWFLKGIQKLDSWRSYERFTLVDRVRGTLYTGYLQFKRQNFGSG